MIREVPWSRLPLGCVIIDWPTLHAAGIPELSEYPVITERLRDHLTQTYQFLRNRSVTIADPSSGIELPRVREVAGEAGALLRSVDRANTLKKAVRQDLVTQLNVKTGIAQQHTYESSPYRLTHKWTRGVVDMLGENGTFCDSAWPTLNQDSRVADVVIGMLTGGIPPLSITRMTADIAFDVSRSMMIDGRGETAYAQAVSLAGELSYAFPLVQWRLWMVSDGATIAADGKSVNHETSLEKTMQAKKVRAGETRFAPFLDAMIRRRPLAGAQLVLTYFPLFSVVTFDVYEQYLGQIAQAWAGTKPDQ